MNNGMNVQSNDCHGELVRTVHSIGDNRDVYYVAYDVARVLGFADEEAAVCAYCHEVNMQPNISTSSPNKLISLINIEDVSRLIAKAKENKAWAFEYWLSQRMEQDKIVSNENSELELGERNEPSDIEPSTTLETTIHNFMGMELRTVQVENSNENKGLDLGSGNAPSGFDAYFVAKDVAVTLNYSNTKYAISTHCKYTRTARILSGGQTREVAIIKQSDVFRLVMRSKLPQAEAFQDWVVEVVLPSIQKTGFYSMDQATKTVPSKIDLLIDHIATENARLALEVDNKALKHQALLDAPKVEFHDGVATLSGDTSVRKAAQTLGTGLVRLMSWLRDNKWVCVNNVPMQSAINKGFLTSNVSSYEHPDLGLSERVVTRITPKGLIELSKHKIP